MIDDLLRLVRLIDDLDEEDYELDLEAGANSASIRPSTGSRSRRERSGREKFETRRKIKKLNRLLKKLERDDDLEPEEVLESETPEVRVVETDAGCQIVVDAAGAVLELDGRDVVLTVGDHEVRRTLDGEPETIERTEKIGTTLFEITL